MYRPTRVLAISVLLGCSAAPALAAVTISSRATQNMSCSNGICTPTGKDAVLNVGDLETLLASGNVEVTTTGSGVQAKNINVRAGVSWSTGSTLALDANESLTFYQPVSVHGIAGLTLTTDDGGKNGELSFLNNGHVTFDSLASTLTINNSVYHLESDPKDLGNAIAIRPQGSYALANSYDASEDGVYLSSPISATFKGQFSGLGNTISNLVIADTSDSDSVGLFAQLGTGATIQNIRLAHVTIDAPNTPYGVGGLVGLTEGVIANSYAHGRIQGGGSGGSVGGLVGTVYDADGLISKSEAGGHISLSAGGEFAGGLAGFNDGQIVDSSSESSMKGGSGSDFIGGLVGCNAGTIQEDFAIAAIEVHGAEALVGGLVGASYQYGDSRVVNSYATGSIKNSGNGQFRSYVGGLMGENFEGSVNNSYSAGSVSAKTNTLLGGFFGANQASAASSYWDTTTSGTDQGSGDGNETGITGLTTEQLQSGLPDGFDPSVWTENPNINGGLPYLLHNPPPK